MGIILEAQIILWRAEPCQTSKKRAKDVAEQQIRKIRECQTSTKRAKDVAEQQIRKIRECS